MDTPVGGYCYNKDDCNSNWYAHQLLNCCGIDLGYRVAWGWNDCSRYTFTCNGKPEGPGPKWTEDRKAREAREAREREGRDRDRGRYYGGFTCFVAGTPVAADAGLVPVETLAAGQCVLSCDPVSAERASGEIVRTIVGYSTALVHIRLEAETLHCTPQHPFWVIDRGWVDAGYLQEGDLLLTADGQRTPILTVTHQNLLTPVLIYNITVAGQHTFFVGKSRILVHNKPP
jgi:hypothetical protein